MIQSDYRINHLIQLFINITTGTYDCAEMIKFNVIINLSTVMILHSSVST